MKLLEDGLDIPDDLLADQERRELIFLCGAGVSKPVGLPLFGELVQEVYDTLRVKWDRDPVERVIMKEGGPLYKQYDRALARLERRVTDKNRIRNIVNEKLQPPSGLEHRLEGHKALLDLSRDEKNVIRLVTTNFDTLFERAWPGSNKVLSSAGQAMPQPKTTNFSGVLHLHGRVADTDMRLEMTDLVLTSPDFGEAYLRSGWASRYVYDLARAYTVVLIGYQADDPPMRYLLEALEADRKRFPDIKNVYAFAAIEEDDEELSRALWESKGVEPILYNPEGDHGVLYSTIIEWRNFAQNPAAWREKKLGRLIAEDPEGESDDVVKSVSSLLDYEDGSQMLRKLDPKPAWMHPLQQQGLFESNMVSPGAWIATHINNLEMIRSVANLPSFDELTVREVERALWLNRKKLNSVRVKSWEIMLHAKRIRSVRDHELSWYRYGPRIRAGKVGYPEGSFLANRLRPMVKVKRPFSSYVQPASHEFADETLQSLIRINFEAPVRVDYLEIIKALPEDEISLVRMLRILERTLLDALEYAEYVECEDQSDYDVRSVAHHDQNKWQYAFCPIVRVMAEIWLRLASVALSQAVSLSRAWVGGRFTLIRRLAIFAATNAAHPPADLAKSIMILDDSDFWASCASVEIMRGLLVRWDDLTFHDRTKIERRICEGPPRGQFDEQHVLDEDDWEYRRDRSIHLRLKRLEGGGKVLGENAKELLQKIGDRYPELSPSTGDRDDFPIWRGGVQWGPIGNEAMLEGVSDEQLVEEALRIERENPFDQHDLWRQLCVTNIHRAFRGLKEEAANGKWNDYVWRPLFAYSATSSEESFVLEIADAIYEMPDDLLSNLDSHIASWIENNQASLDANLRNECSLLWLLWDRLAKLIYKVGAMGEEGSDDPVQLNSNGAAGVALTQTLVDRLVAGNPERCAGLGALKPRFTMVAQALGEAAIEGRKKFAQFLSTLYSIDSDWTEVEILPYFHVEHDEALGMWQANTFDGAVGSPILFNMLKDDLL